MKIRARPQNTVQFFNRFITYLPQQLQKEKKFILCKFEDHNFVLKGI
jgi:hypothetical protein